MNSPRNLDVTRKIVTDKMMIEANPTTGDMQVRPDFTNKAVYLHPVPTKLQSRVKSGEVWAGWWGRNHDSGKLDSRNRPIFVRYFIPVEKVG